MDASSVRKEGEPDDRDLSRLAVLLGRSPGRAASASYKDELSPELPEVVSHDNQYPAAVELVTNSVSLSENVITPRSAADGCRDEQSRMELAATSEPPCSSRGVVWRKRATGSLVVIVAYLGMVVKAELTALPEHAFDGALLRARIRLGAVVHGGFFDATPASRPVVTAATKFVPNAHARKKPSRAQRRRERTLAGAGDDNWATVETTVKPLLPFRIEVADGHQRRVFDSRPDGVEVSVLGSAVPFLSDANKRFILDSTQRRQSEGVVLFRAIIGKDGRPEHLWKISGPPELTDEAMRIARGLRFGPYYRNGVPVEMEAILTVKLPAGGR